MAASVLPVSEIDDLVDETINKVLQTRGSGSLLEELWGTVNSLADIDFKDNTSTVFFNNIVGELYDEEIAKIEEPGVGASGGLKDRMNKSLLEHINQKVDSQTDIGNAVQAALNNNTTLLDLTKAVVSEEKVRESIMALVNPDVTEEEKTMPAYMERRRLQQPQLAYAVCQSVMDTHTGNFIESGQHVSPTIGISHFRVIRLDVPYDEAEHVEPAVYIWLSPNEEFPDSIRVEINIKNTTNKPVYPLLRQDVYGPTEAPCFVTFEDTFNNIHVIPSNELRTIVMRSLKVYRVSFLFTIHIFREI